MQSFDWVFEYVLNEQNAEKNFVDHDIFAE